MRDLPRAARLVITLYGGDWNNASQTLGTGAVALGWAAVNLFCFDGCVVVLLMVNEWGAVAMLFLLVLVSILTLKICVLAIITYI
jgi:hypothetical protein